MFSDLAVNFENMWKSSVISADQMVMGSLLHIFRNLRDRNILINHRKCFGEL